MRLTLLLVSLFFISTLIIGATEPKVAEKQEPGSTLPAVDLALFLVDGEYEEFLKQESVYKPKDRTARGIRHLQKLLAYYETGQYKKMEIEGWNLPKKYASSFFVKYLSMQAYFARKRFKQATALYGELSSAYPLAMHRDESACLSADMALYRRHYDDAISAFEECLPDIKNKAMSAYRLILAKEKGRSPKSRLLGEYLEYDAKYPSSPGAVYIRERLMVLYNNHNIPTSDSPYFGTWLYAMKRNGLLKKVVKKEWFEVDEPPFALISYLFKEERFSDAQKLAKKGKESVAEDDDTKRYRYGWRIYRSLIKGGQPNKAGDYLVSFAAELKKVARKDQAFFFAAFAYDEAGEYDKAEKLFTQIIYQEKRSPYFILSLQRLGLLYLATGREWYAITLWTNFLLDDISTRGQHGGYRALQSMQHIAAMISRMSGFYTLGSQAHILCYDKGEDDVEGFVSYYDFLWTHLNRKSVTKNIMKSALGKERIDRWKNYPQLHRKEHLAQLKKSVRKLPRSLREGEYARMMSVCAEGGLNSCLNFYFSKLNDALSTARKPPENLEAEAESFLKNAATPKMLLFSRATGSFLKLAHRDADFVDYHFGRNAGSLSYAPHFEKSEGWFELYPTPLRDIALDAATQFDVPPALLYAIMRAETMYRPFLTSPVGAGGLMQIMPTTFEKIAISSGMPLDNPFNPRQSIRAAAWYLGKLLKRFDNNPIVAAAAYNGGPHNVTKWIKRYSGLPLWILMESAPFKETRNYMKKVARYMEIYSYLYEGQYYDLGLQRPLDIKERPEVVTF